MRVTPLKLLDLILVEGWGAGVPSLRRSLKNRGISSGSDI
jgi:hypothetical protein